MNYAAAALKLLTNTVALKSRLRQLQEKNGLAVAGKETRAEVKRILRKSREFRSDAELDMLVGVLGHLDFPVHLRMPGIDQAQEIRELCRLMYFRKFDEGSYVYQMGTEATTVYIVLRGDADVDFGMLDNSAAISGSVLVRAGGFFGEDAAGEAAKYDGLRKIETLPPIYKGMALATTELECICIDRVDIERQYLEQVVEEGAKMKVRYLQEATGHLRGFFSGWDFLKETDGVRVYRKSAVDSDAICFKGIGFIEKPVEQVAAYLMDMNNRENWDPLYMHGETLERIDDNNVLRYEFYHTPSPVHYNRDFLTLCSNTVDKGLREYFILSRSVKNVACQPQPNAVRATAMDCGFFLKPETTGADDERLTKAEKAAKKEVERTQVTFLSMVDFQGNYPNWLENNINEEQASYIRHIRRAMDRIIVGERMKTILLDAGMLFTVKATFEHQGLALWAFDHNNMNEVVRMQRTHYLNLYFLTLALKLIEGDEYASHTTEPPQDLSRGR